MSPCKYLAFVLVVYLPVLLFSQAQSPAFRNVRYDIQFNQLSPDGKHLIFRKKYGHSSDTLAVLKTAQPETVFYQTPGVTKSFFSRTNTLFILKKNAMEVLNFKTERPEKYEGVMKAEYLRKHKVIAVLVREDSGDKAIIFGEDGKLLRKIPNINRISVMPSGDAFFIGKKDGRTFLWELEQGQVSLLYKTTGNILGVTASDSAQVVLQEQNVDRVDDDMVFIDRLSHDFYPLKNVVSLPFVEFKTTLTATPGVVYVMAYLKDTGNKHENPEIWYGNDPAITKKFYPAGQRLTYFLWDVKGKKIKVLDREKFPETAYVGNTRYYVATDPFQFADDTVRDAPLFLKRLDLQTGTYADLGLMGPHVFFDPSGEYMVSKIGKDWKLINLPELSERIIPLPYAETCVFSEDSRFIYFEQEGAVVRYEIRYGTLKYYNTAPGFTASIKNFDEEKLLWQFGFYRRTVPDHMPLLIELHHPRNGSSGLMIIKGDKSEFPLPPNADRISSVYFDPEAYALSYVTENLTVPPKLWTKKGDARTRLVYQSNKCDRIISKIKKEIYDYRSSEDIPLSGLLIYPENFDSKKKYPMIVQIYEIESRYRNRYLRDGYYRVHEGINIRHYIENGYFVFMPDIVFGNKGPGYSALDCIEKAMEAIAGHANIDFKKVGLTGHSHGAYETNFIATQSKSFATYVSGAGNADLVRSYFSYNYNFNSPFYWQFEERQYRMFKPFAEDKNLYISNSPVYHAEKVNRPILLWTGKQDQNINWEQTMEFYLALRRAKREVTALFYDGEEHVIADAVRKKDLFTRISEWFGYYLKGEPADWISSVEK